MADGQDAGSRYVHDPEAFSDHERERGDANGDGAASGTDFDTQGSRSVAPRNDPRPDSDAAIAVPERKEFGRRGWVLVGVLVIALLIVPGLIVAAPPALPFEIAFLALPMLPAVLLGIVAVWSALDGV